MTLLTAVQTGVLGLRHKIHYLEVAAFPGVHVDALIREINRASDIMKIVMHGYGSHIRDLPQGDEYVFSIRNPVSRFVSAFYDRKQAIRTAPSDATPHERQAYADFEHANDLAESLFERGRAGDKAFGAMKSIRGVAVNQSDSFTGAGNFLAVTPPLFIIRQENYVDDFRFLEDLIGLRRLIGAGHYAEKPQHHGDEIIPGLSKKARKNLHEWFLHDLEFYGMCDAWIEDRLNRPMFP